MRKTNNNYWQKKHEKFLALKKRNMIWTSNTLVNRTLKTPMNKL